MSENNYISIKGARVNNLKNIDVDIPQQYESLRITAAYQALPAMAFPTNNHRRGRK